MDLATTRMDVGSELTKLCGTSRPSSTARTTRATSACSATASLRIGGVTGTTPLRRPLRRHRILEPETPMDLAKAKTDAGSEPTRLYGTSRLSSTARTTRATNACSATASLRIGGVTGTTPLRTKTLDALRHDAATLPRMSSLRE